MTKMLRTLLVPALVLLHVSLAHASLPPHSSKNLSEEASHIFVGYVYSVANHEERRSEGVDAIHTAKMIVKDVEKGEGFDPDNIVSFQFWQAKKRPDRWGGDNGQTALLPPHTQARIYLLKTETGQLLLLSPEGWQKISY